MAPADGELRIQVRISAPEHPELYRHLIGLRPRARAERIRQMAAAVLVGSPRVAEQSVRITETNAEGSPPDPRRARLLSRLDCED
jgi:hypothetical protein